MAFLRLLSQARRTQHLISTSQQSHSLPSLRFFSSSKAADPSDQPQPQPQPKPSPSILVQPVSYAVKPPTDSPLQTSVTENANPEEVRSNWTREDARYVKNEMPSIVPVSYPSRVAPLQEDKPVAEGGEEGNKEEMSTEGRKIEDRARRRFAFKAEEELEKVPFPTLIRVEKKKKVKEVYDLAEAIELVKVSVTSSLSDKILDKSSHTVLFADSILVVLGEDFLRTISSMVK